MNNYKLNDILNNGDTEFISVVHAARFLGVHKNTIYTYIRNGNIDAYKFKGDNKSIFIKKEDLLKNLVPIIPDKCKSKSNKTVLYD